MNFKFTDLLISMFKIVTLENVIEIKSDIEKLEMYYEKEYKTCHQGIVDTLMYLHLTGNSDIIKIDDLIKRLEYIRYIGSIPRIQITILQIAELYFEEDMINETMVFLKEAVQIYKEYGICASFLALPYKSINMLQNIDNKLYNNLFKNNRNIKICQDLSLSIREKEIMKLVMKGKSNKDISDTLYISVGTVKWHLSNIFGKLGVKNRIQAIEKVKDLL